MQLRKIFRLCLDLTRILTCDMHDLKTHIIGEHVKDHDRRKEIVLKEGKVCFIYSFI